MINMKKVTAAALSVALVFSMTACMGGNKDEIIDAADTFAKAVTALDGKKIIKLTEELDGDKADSIKDKLAMTNLESDEKEVKQAIAATLTYALDEESVEFGDKNESATIDATFTLVDYAKALDDDDLSDADSMVEAINDQSKTKDYEVKLEFVKDEDSWLVSEDTIDDLGDVYAFLGYELSFGASGGDVVSMIDHTSWWMSSNDNYENATYIELDLWFTSNPGVNVYYKVTKDGTEVYTSDVESFSSSYYEAKYGEEQNAQMSGSYIAAGNYSIQIFAEDGTLLADESTVVTVSSSSTSASSTPSSSSTYTIVDGNFANIKELGWWDYGVEEDDGTEHGTMAADAVYCIDSETIAFSIELNEEGPDIYYAYYFIPGENADASSVDYANPTFADTISVTAYRNGTMFYNIDYTPDTMEVGTYVLVIASSADQVTNPYITAACTVIPQDSSDFM